MPLPDAGTGLDWSHLVDAARAFEGKDAASGRGPSGTVHSQLVRRMPGGPEPRQRTDGSWGDHVLPGRGCRTPLEPRRPAHAALPPLSCRRPEGSVEDTGHALPHGVVRGCGRGPSDTPRPLAVVSEGGWVGWSLSALHAAIHRFCCWDLGRPGCPSSQPAGEGWLLHLAGGERAARDPGGGCHPQRSQPLLGDGRPHSGGGSLTRPRPQASRASPWGGARTPGAAPPAPRPCLLGL